LLCLLVRRQKKNQKAAKLEVLFVGLIDRQTRKKKKGTHTHTRKERQDKR